MTRYTVAWEFVGGMIREEDFRDLAKAKDHMSILLALPLEMGICRVDLLDNDRATLISWEKPKG